jgi:hypothetical protein
MNFMSRGIIISKDLFIHWGHTSDTPAGFVYSVIVSYDIVQNVFFTATLNNLDVWATDASIAVLQCPIPKRIYTLASPNCFGDRMSTYPNKN